MADRTWHGPSNVAGTERTPILRILIALPLLAVYVTSFWGNFGTSWPEWITEHTGWIMRPCWAIYRQHVHITQGWGTHYQLLWLVVSAVLAGVVPVAVMMMAGRSLKSIGLGLPNSWGRKMAVCCILITIPFAFLFAHERMAMPSRGISFGIQAILLVGISLPEHILLTGVCLAIFLPGCRLPKPLSPAQVEGRSLRRALRWLGIAQPAAAHDPPFLRFLVWWGLNVPSLWAMIAAGLLFGLIHVGARPIEFFTSFPGGAALCYLTYRSGSIWPGWIIHIAQMGLVAIFMALQG